MKIIKHKNSSISLEQIIISEGKHQVRFNIWISTHYRHWIGESVGFVGEEKITLTPCDTRDEIIGDIEVVAEEYLKKIKGKNKND